MALVQCPDCGTDVSDAAPACPKCGRPARNILGQEKAITVKPQTSCVTIGCLGVFILVIAVIIAHQLTG